MREFTNERLELDRRDQRALTADGVCIEVRDPEAVLSYAEYTRLVAQLVARWNAVADTLAVLREARESGRLGVGALDAYAILRSAVHHSKEL